VAIRSGYRPARALVIPPLRRSASRGRSLIRRTGPVVSGPVHAPGHGSTESGGRLEGIGRMAQRRYEFTITPAVESARKRAQYIACPACESRQQRYLFHRKGARFVRCRACGLVYADPVDPRDRRYFGIDSVGQHSRPADTRNLIGDFAHLVDVVLARYQQQFGKAAQRVLVVGRWHPGYSTAVKSVEIRSADDYIEDESELASRPLVDTIGAALDEFDVILLTEYLEAVHDPAGVLKGLAEGLPERALLAVSFANMLALPSRVLRRRWKSFFDRKIAFYDSDNLELLMWRCGFERIGQEQLPTTHSIGYALARFEVFPRLQATLDTIRAGGASLRTMSGYEVAFFTAAETRKSERLSIIIPVYNEERYLAEVLNAILARELPIEREIILVESNSSDGSRDIVRSFEGREGLRIIYQERARGKGNAVREALQHATGSIVLIQDADFEYDLDDYDALLEPILQRRTSFVLGSRSLGLDDWKVRRYASSPVKSFLMNFAQLVFAKTFNILYQQKVTDINTMFKVFRRECVDGVRFDGNGFNFDIELVCKIVRHGYDPLEVPVNYVARSFEEGKKINFLFDAYPSYYQLFRCRFGVF
jgi:hypothetical protein